MSTLVGRTLGRFRIIERLGAGGMGEVYRARDDHLARDVAIKFLTSGSDDDSRARMRREAHALSAFNHPNIATIHDLGHEGGTDFVVMEYIGGQSLAERLTSGPLEISAAIHIARQVASGLQEAHDHGIIHRDLKPGNVMMTPKGQVKVVDFGLAVQPEATPDAETRSAVDIGVPVGTLPYMAPEQIRGAAIDARTDIWAFGALLYALVTGRRPFAETRSLPLIDRILNRDPPRPSAVDPHVPLSLERIILKALSKAPEERYQSAAEIVSALDLFETGDTPDDVRPPRRWRGLAAAAAALALAATVGGARWLWPAAPEPTARLAVLVGDTVNRTGEVAFDGTVGELLSTSLEQSRFISLFPRTRLTYVLGLMQRDPATVVDDGIGREIALREGLGALVTSSVSRLGDSYVLVVSMEDPNGRVIGTARATFTDPADLPARMDVVAQELRVRVGETAESIQANYVPLADVTSKSLEAVRFFTLGRRAQYGGQTTNAIALFEQALERDPQFAMAHEYLGLAYTNLRDHARAEIHVAEAMTRVDRLPEAERHKILADYNMLRRNYDEACPHLEVLVDIRPLDPTPLLSLGLCKSFQLDYDSAVDYASRAIELQDTHLARINLARSQFLGGDLQTALDGANAARERQPANFQAHYVAGQAELALGRLDAAQGTYETMVDLGGAAEVEGRLRLADLLLARGRLREARVALDSAWQVADRVGSVMAAGRMAVARMELAVVEERPDDLVAPLARLDGVDEPVVTFLIARALARAGRVADARRVAADRAEAEAGPARSLATNWLGHDGPVSVPAGLVGRVVDVLGFNERPHLSRSALPLGSTRHTGGRRRTYLPTEVARLYDFPDDLDWRGQTVGVIALGGGYRRSDLTAFYKRLDLPMPTFEDVCVGGARNAPEGPSGGFDGEVTADIETVGALVPAARIVVYFGPNSDRGFLEAVSRAVHDQQRAPSVISISWGMAETEWTRRTLALFNQVLAEAAVLGVTVCCSSGDHGVMADLRDRVPHVCFPACSPYALACGGTSLIATRRGIISEAAWNCDQGESGGGVSGLFDAPPWQSGYRIATTRTGHRGRGVPDVAADGDPDTGYRVYVGGKWCSGAGTSASAPLWAGLIARINQRRGSPVGLITPYLYRHRPALVKAGALYPIRRLQGKPSVALGV